MRVLSAADPGACKRRSTAGHREDILFARWIRNRATPLISKTRVVQRQDWRLTRPADAHTVTSGQRATDHCARRCT
ncbi:MAG: hypothetical protein U0587_21420 [Candidatus Binatia bacterium]